MTIISIGKIDKDLIPIVIACVFEILFKLLTKIKNTILFHHSIITNIYVAASKLFSIIPYILLKIRSRKVKEKEDADINIRYNVVNYIYTDVHKETTKGRFKYIILSSTLFFIQGITLFYANGLKINIWISEIFIYCIFYYLIFKIKPHKHHYLSIILIILTGIILDLILKNLQNDIINNWQKIFLRLLREILFSLQDVINKYIMEKKFCSVYELSLYGGIIYLILLGIFSIFNYYYFHLDNFEEYLNNFNHIELLVAIGTMIAQFVLDITSLFTIKNNTPCHLFIISVFAQIIVYIDDFSEQKAIIIIFLIFIFLLSLVFNEIIEINCFGLSKNTKRNIMNRALSEEFYSLNEQKDLSSDEGNENNEAFLTKNNNMVEFPLIPINNSENELVNDYN